MNVKVARNFNFSMKNNDLEFQCHAIKIENITFNYWIPWPSKHYLPMNNFTKKIGREITNPEGLQQPFGLQTWSK